MRIRIDAGYDSRTHRILDDVPRMFLDGRLIADTMIEISCLPYVAATMQRKIDVVRGGAFHPLNDSAQFGPSESKHPMDMIRHHDPRYGDDTSVLVSMLDACDDAARRYRIAK